MCVCHGACRVRIAAVCAIGLAGIVAKRTQWALAQWAVRNMAGFTLHVDETVSSLLLAHEALARWDPLVAHPHLSHPAVWT